MLRYQVLCYAGDGAGWTQCGTCPCWQLWWSQKMWRRWVASHDEKGFWVLSICMSWDTATLLCRYSLCEAQPGTLFWGALSGELKGEGWHWLYDFWWDLCARSMQTNPCTPGMYRWKHICLYVDALPGLGNSWSGILWHLVLGWGTPIAEETEIKV